MGTAPRLRVRRVATCSRPVKTMTLLTPRARPTHPRPSQRQACVRTTGRHARRASRETESKLGLSTDTPHRWSPWAPDQDSRLAYSTKVACNSLRKPYTGSINGCAPPLRSLSQPTPRKSHRAPHRAPPGGGGGGIRPLRAPSEPSRGVSEGALTTLQSATPSHVDTHRPSCGLRCVKRVEGPLRALRTTASYRILCSKTGHPARKT